jgi:hypothetical protein
MRAHVAEETERAEQHTEGPATDQYQVQRSELINTYQKSYPGNQKSQHQGSLQEHIHQVVLADGYRMQLVSLRGVTFCNCAACW